MTGEHIRGIPRTYEKEITLADTPYTLSVGFNCVKVDTTGGNVRVNLPNVNYPIDVIKTSSDSYIVTVWVGGVQKATVAGELSKITIENAEVTADEPWYPYDAIVGIVGDEVLAKNKYGKVIARGVAGTEYPTITQAAIDYVYGLGGGVVEVIAETYSQNDVITIKSGVELHLNNGVLINATADSDLYYVKNQAKLLGGKIVCSGIAYTSAVVTIDGVDNPARGTEIDVHITNSAYTGKGVYLKSTEAAGGKIWGVKVSGYIRGFEYGCHLYRSGEYGDNWINGNYFDLLIYASVKCFYMEHSGSPSSDLDGNRINVQIESSSIHTTHGIVVGGRYNTIEAMIWDWKTVAGDKGVWCQSGSNYNYVVVGISTKHTLDNGTNNIWVRTIQDLAQFGTLSCSTLSFDDLGSITAGNYLNTKIISPSGGHYSTLSAAYTATTDAGENNRYTFLIFGVVDETNKSIFVKDCIDVIFMGGELHLHGSSKVTFASTSSVRWINPIIKKYSVVGNLNGHVIYCSENSKPDIIGGKLYGDEGETTTLNGYTVYCDDNSVPKFRDTDIYLGKGTNKHAIHAMALSRPTFDSCVVKPTESDYSWEYTSADSGRFRPYDSIAYQLVLITVKVTSATPGASLSVGTTVGGTEIASGIDISSTGYKSFAFTMSTVSAGGYLYATPSVAIVEGSVDIYYTVVENIANYIVHLSGYTSPLLNNCSVFANALASSLYIAGSTSVPRITASEMRNYSPSTGYALRGSTAITGENISHCKIDGLIQNISCIDNKSSGSSTGTGAEQTIAHSLSAIPTGCKAWIKYLVGARYITEMIPFDATNVYPTVASGVAYEWRIE